VRALVTTAVVDAGVAADARKEPAGHARADRAVNEGSSMGHTVVSLEVAHRDRYQRMSYVVTVVQSADIRKATSGRIRLIAWLREWRRRAQMTSTESNF
jgi:hypothetical protein